MAHDDRTSREVSHTASPVSRAASDTRCGGVSVGTEPGGWVQYNGNDRRSGGSGNFRADTMRYSPYDNNKPPRRTGGGGDGACYSCGEPGHLARDCPDGDRGPPQRRGGGGGGGGGGTPETVERDRPREDGLAHPAGTSRSNLPAAFWACLREAREGGFPNLS
jgi:hypothetical protein